MDECGDIGVSRFYICWFVRRLLANNTQSSRGHHIALDVGFWSSPGTFWTSFLRYNTAHCFKGRLLVQSDNFLNSLRTVYTRQQIVLKKNKDTWLSAVTKYIMLKRVRKVVLVTCHGTGRIEQSGNTWSSPLTKHLSKESRKRVPPSTVTKQWPTSTGSQIRTGYAGVVKGNWSKLYPLWYA
jgi:hypothetical protein